MEIIWLEIFILYRHSDIYLLRKTGLMNHSFVMFYCHIKLFNAECHIRVIKTSVNLSFILLTWCHSRDFNSCGILGVRPGYNFPAGYSRTELVALDSSIMSPCMIDTGSQQFHLSDTLSTERPFHQFYIFSLLNQCQRDSIVIMYVTSDHWSTSKQRLLWHCWPGKSNGRNGP